MGWPVASECLVACLFFVHKLILPPDPQMRRHFTDLFSLLKLT